MNDNVFSHLRGNPTFTLLRAELQLKPNLLQSTLQRICNNYPNLYRTILENREQFYQFINEPLYPGNLRTCMDNRRQTQNIPYDTIPCFPPDYFISAITFEDNERINNMISMGFDRKSAIEAFFLFEKDEIMAVNFLLD